MILLWFALGCGTPATSDGTPSADHAAMDGMTGMDGSMDMSGGHCHHDMAAGKATTASLYVLDAELVDQDGKATRLDVDKGHPVVVGMFYSSCKSACPMLVQKISGVEAKLSPEERANVRVLLVSFDPKRDTPDALRGLAAAQGIDTSRWTLATPKDDDGVRDVSALLGVKYRVQEDGSINHSSVLTVLDGDGVVTARIEGLDADDTPVVDALKKLAS